MRFVALFCAVFAVYLATLHPTVAPYRDSGDLTVAAHTLGIAHPPGYPLYALTGKVFRTLVPLGNPGYGMNVWSALCGAAAVTLVALALESAIAGSALAACMAALMLACSPALWRLSQVSEMYALNALFGAVMLMLAAALIRVRSSARMVPLVWLAAFVGGLACGNHQTIILVLPAFVWLAWSMGMRDLRSLGMAVLFFAAGLSVYFFLPVRSLNLPVADWGHPASLHNFMRVITRADYGGMRLHPEQSTLHWTIGTVWAQILVYGTVVIAQFTGAGLLAGLWGMWVRRKDPFIQFCAGALILSGPFFVVLSNLPPQEATTLPILEPHMVLPNLFFAVLIAAGIVSLPLSSMWRRCIALAFVLLACGVHAPQCWYRGQFQAWDYGRNVRVTMEPNSMLYSPDDSSAFITAYAQTVCGKRPDITPVVYYRTRWGYEEMKRLHPDLLPGREISSGEELSRVLLVYNQGRRAVYADLPAKFPQDLLSYPRGLLYRLSGKGEYVPSLDPFSFYAMRGVSPKGSVRNDFFTDHVISYYSSALNNLGMAFANVRRFDVAARCYHRALAIEPALNAAVNNLGTLAFAQGNYAEALRWFDRALQREPQSASAHYNRGCAFKAQGKINEAVADFTWAWEHDGNPDAGNELGLIAMAADPLRAAAIFQAVIQKEPNYLNAYYNMGLALQRGGDAANARRAFEIYYTNTPDPRDKAEVRARMERLPR